MGKIKNMTFIKGDAYSEGYYHGYLAGCNDSKEEDTK